MMRPDPKLTKVYLCIEPVDFRKAIQGLSLLVEQSLGLNPFEAALFVFVNRRRDKIKILYWEKNGFCLWYKRLEKERFKWPRKGQGTIMNLSEDQWRWLLSGYDIEGHQPLQFASFSG